MSNIRGVKPPTRKLDRHIVLNQIMMNNFDYDHIESRIELPRDIFVVAYHRRFVKKSEFLFN